MNSQNNTPDIKEDIKMRPLECLYNRKWKKVLLIILCILLCLALAVVGTFGAMWLSGRSALLDNGNQSMTAPSGYEVDIDEDGVVRPNRWWYCRANVTAKITSKSGEVLEKTVMVEFFKLAITKRLPVF